MTEIDEAFHALEEERRAVREAFFTAADKTKVPVLVEALRHYDNEQHWTANVGEHTTWVYDGGNALPWKVAREALATLEET
jgi:hypothetical protein